MAAFDWPAFLERHRIEYRDHGPNVGHEHIVIRCPFCATADPGMHMSIALDGKGWHCWRDPNHAGINPNRMIMQLLKIDWSAAAAISGTSKGYQQQQPVQAHTLLDKVNVLLHSTPPSPSSLFIEFPKSAKPLSAPSRTSMPYSLYMRGRGITDMHALDRWDVLYDHRDPRWHGRILFGVRSIASSGNLVAMTGRAVSHRMEPRYLAEGAVDQFLIWTDRMPPKADTLVLTEGPFDALKVNLMGNPQGIWSTCCMTSSYSRTQRSKLYALMPRFRRTVALFDRGNEANAYQLAQGFPGRMSVATLPPTFKDPAELLSLDFLMEAP